MCRSGAGQIPCYGGRHSDRTRKVDGQIPKKESVLKG